MRSRTEVQVCVQADSIEELDELQAHAEQAVLQAVADRHIDDPEDGSAVVSTVEGLDAAANAALDAAATE